MIDHFTPAQGDRPFGDRSRYLGRPFSHTSQTLGLAEVNLRHGRNEAFEMVFKTIQRLRNVNAINGASLYSRALNVPQIAAQIVKRYNEINQKGGSPWQAVDLHRN